MDDSHVLSPIRTVANPTVNTFDPLLVVDARRLAVMLCCGIRTLRSWDASGKLPAPIRIGGHRVVWRLREIIEWLDAGAPDRETWTARCAVQK